MISRLSTAVLILASIMSTAGLAQPQLDWTRTYHGDRNEYFEDVVQAADDGFLMAASVQYADGVVLTKTTPNGDVDWTSTIAGDVMRFCGHLCMTTDHGFILAGAIMGADDRDHLVLQKITASGYPQWRFVLNEDRYPEISWVAATDDGGCVAGGFIFPSAPLSMALIFKVDADGQLQWERIYGGSDYEKCIAVLPTEGGYFMMGSRYSSEENPPLTLWVMKVDDVGEMVWSQAYGFPHQAEFSCAHVAADGGLAVAGIYYLDQPTDWYLGERVLIRLNANGDSLWTRSYLTAVTMTCTSMDCTPDGGYVLAGDGGMLRLTDQGDSLWFFPTTSDVCLRAADGGFLLGGTTFANDDADVFLVKTDPEPSAAHVAGNPFATAVQLLPNYPNPFNAVTTIRFDLVRDANVTLRLFDMSGRLTRTILAGHYSAGEHSTRFDASGLASGPYFYRLNAGDVQTTKKMMLVK